MEKSAKIFVAGYNGLVGSALVRRLNKNGFINMGWRHSVELEDGIMLAYEDFLKMLKDKAFAHRF